MKDIAKAGWVLGALVLAASVAMLLGEVPGESRAFTCAYVDDGHGNLVCRTTNCFTGPWHCSSNCVCIDHIEK